MIISKHINLHNIPSIKKVLKAITYGNSLKLSGCSSDFLQFLAAFLSDKTDFNLVFITKNRKETELVSREISNFLNIIDIKRKVFTLIRIGDDLSSALKDMLPVIDNIKEEHFIPHLIILQEDLLNLALPDLSLIKKGSYTVSADISVSMDSLLKRSADAGYERSKYVEIKGEMSRRGGIFDIFPVNKEAPVRIEFFGDKIESMRYFSPLDQTSREKIKDSVSIFPVNTKLTNKPFFSLLFPKSIVIHEHFLSDIFEKSLNKAKISIHSLPSALDSNKKDVIAFNTVPTSIMIPFIPSMSISKSITSAIKDLPPNVKLFVSAPDEYSLDDLKQEFSGYKRDIVFFISSLMHGFYWKNAKIFLITFNDIFKKQAKQNIQASISTAHLFESITEIFKKGDIVVHTQYGLGRFIGTTRLKRAKGAKEHIVLEFADKAKLYVPQEHFFMLQKYIGLQKKDPPLDNLHSKKWTHKKRKVQVDLFAYANDLLKLEAERNLKKGFSFNKNSLWVKEFENSFIYQDTPDQKKTTLEVYKDMESKRSMDRLILGDVGYGKTEIAMRAAFKAAVCEKQIAVLVPTTILAQQHGNTFRERMANFPIRIEVLSRFQTIEKQNEIIKDIQKGSVDIVIGTHRLLQADISFKDLGLIVIDEEQKFGVKQKNALRQISTTVDILTLSATPIPRTLYLSLMGARSISFIKTPPLDRKPIKTILTHADKNVIRQAVTRELKRSGQIFVIHNRIQTIHGIARWIQQISPKAKISVAHGRMERDKLKNIMDDFYAGKIDILISTIIIQSGIDIQNVNTMIIHNADMFGLADLYQLRGRIGRADKLAYAYFLISKERAHDKNVKERIQAIKEFSSQGGHFKVALKDLEIRGAGNILGTKQSGHIAIIGFDLYCRLLDETISALKGKKIVPLFDVVIETGIPAFLPQDYIPDFMDRFRFYKRAHSINNDNDLDMLKAEMTDRFGTPLKEVYNFIELARLKWLARNHLITRVQIKKEHLLFYRNKILINKYEVPDKISKNGNMLFEFIREKLKLQK
ncbi:MAG: transcription-repair coupling factor [Candidatus Aureabacteria bacterium]|nr:transcription-repair coupling factor [Candidatus Auribacterota bacterium]